MVFWAPERGDWHWRSWAELAAAMERAASDEPPTAVTLPATPEQLAVAFGALVPPAPEAVAAIAAAVSPAAAPGRPIALLAPLDESPGRAWLCWVLTAGACLVLPPRPDLLSWALWWSRPTHAAFASGDLPALRAGLLAEQDARALRRRLRRLRVLLAWGAPPAAAEEHAWAELGIRPRHLERRW